jgi:hypothetical protein
MSWVTAPIVCWKLTERTQYSGNGLEIGQWRRKERTAI